MIRVIIDGIEVETRKSATILQACLDVGVEIPRFCYHERLSIAGNCRMCLVEVEKSPKPVASCAMPVLDGMKIYTNTPLVLKAREGVLEFLLVNHPLDCPICDQGGECDLQDLTMVYGSDRGRFYEYKRGVEDKNLGPLVKTIMTRCIHCTRCVRFATEVAGVEDLGTVGRGRDTEISTYIEKIFDSELSGNVIDLCPVGALTSKPYAFTARPWELESIESIDVSDGVCSNIRIDVRGSEIMRVLPRLNEEVNEEWISDKARFSYDGLKRQRLTTPLLKVEDSYVSITWKDIFSKLQIKFDNTEKNNGSIFWILGKQMDVESSLLVKEISSKYINSFVLSELMWNKTRDVDFRRNFCLNKSLSEVEDSDFILMVGTNPRYEATLLNTRIRKAFLKSRQNIHIGVLGDPVDLTYDFDYLGNDVTVLLSILEGRHLYSKYLLKSKNPLILIGDSIIKRADFNSLLGMFRHFEDLLGFSCFGYLNSNTGSVGHMDLGITGLDMLMNYKFTSNDVIYLCNVDELHAKELFGESFIVYQGHHGDKNASDANVILPGSAYTEKEATFVNLEGRSQSTKQSFSSPGDAREDWKILRSLSEILSKVVSYDNLMSIRYRFSEYSPLLNMHGSLLNCYRKNSVRFSSYNTIIHSKFDRFISNYYLTDPVCRSSSVMAKCSSMYHQSDLK